MGEIADSEIIPDTASQNQEESEPTDDVDLRRHGWRYARTLAIGFIILQLSGLRIPGIFADDPFTLKVLNNAIDLSLVYFTFVIPIAIVVYILAWVFLQLIRRRAINTDFQLSIDFIISSSLVVTLIVNLGTFLSWTSAFLASPTYDIPLLSLVENSIIILSMFFLALGIFYRFLSRLYLKMLSKPKLSTAYLRGSGRMVDRAIGPILGLVTAISMHSLAQLWILAIPLFVQLFTQYEKIQADMELALLDQDMFPKGDVREPIPYIVSLVPRQKFVYEQFRFSMKPLSRWIVLSIGIVTTLYITTTIDTTSVLAFLFGIEDRFYTSGVNPFNYWNLALGVAIFSTALHILTYLFYRLRSFERPEGHVLSPRHKLEWIVDLGVTAVAATLLVFYLLPQIGLEPWNTMRLELFWNLHYAFTPGYTIWSSTVVATVFQVSIALLLTGLIMRIVGNAMGFLGKDEMNTLKWHLRSGKILLIGISFAIGINLLLTGGMFFGVVSSGIVVAGLTLLLSTMMFSKTRMQEIDWFDVGGERSEE